jgi:hypothetical protein
MVKEGHTIEQGAPLLLQYPYMSAADIANAIGVTERTVCNWMKLLGIPRRQHNAYASRKWDHKHCQNCGILLSEARAMDGEGSATECRDCLITTGRNHGQVRTRIYIGATDADVETARARA